MSGRDVIVNQGPPSPPQRDGALTTTDQNPLPKLELPKRWELLKQRADAAKIDPVEVVERVDEAARAGRPKN